MPERGEQGASLVEYALLIALIAVVCMASVSLFGGGIERSTTRSTSSIVGTG